MTRFPTPGHLVSWCGRTPLDRQSGKRDGQARHKKGNRCVAAVTGETSVAADKTGTRYQDLGADYYERQREVAR